MAEHHRIEVPAELAEDQIEAVAREREPRVSGNGHNGGNGGDPVELPLVKADFSSDQETRWCPGCGDYAILASVQGFMPELGIAPEKIVFVTGIGCAGRFVY